MAAAKKEQTASGVRTLADAVPDRAVPHLLACPAAIFIIAMAAELLKCLFSFNVYNADIVLINYAAAVTGLAAIAAYLVKRRAGGQPVSPVLKNPAVLCFGAFVLLMLASTARNGYTDLARVGDDYRCETLGSFILYPAVYYFASSLVGSERVKRRLMDGFLAVSALIAAGSLLHVAAEKCGWTGLASLTAELGSQSVVGIYHQINHYGYSLVIALTLSAALFVTAEKPLRRTLYLAGFALFTATLALNDTFGAYLAVFAALAGLVIVFLIRGRKRLPWTFLLLGVFFAVSLAVNYRLVWSNISTFFTDVQHVAGDIQGSVEAAEAASAGTGRWRIWKETAKLIAERPLLGYGVEGIAERLTASAGIDRPHNEFLQYAAFFGIPAMLCYVGAAASVLVNALRRLHSLSPCTLAALTAAGGYLVSSCFGNTMYYTAPLFFIVLGLADTYPERLSP